MGTFTVVHNDSTLNVDTGIQTPSGTATAGPMSGLTSVVSYRVTACAVELQPITSSLNNQGRVICTMNNKIGFNGLSTAPNGITTARDCEYVTYSSLAGSVGHRMVYHNTSVAEDSFTAYDAIPEADYMEIIIQGAVGNTPVLQVTWSY